MLLATNTSEVMLCVVGRQTLTEWDTRYSFKIMYQSTNPDIYDGSEYPSLGLPITSASFLVNQQTSCSRLGWRGHSVLFGTLHRPNHDAPCQQFSMAAVCPSDIPSRFSGDSCRGDYPGTDKGYPRVELHGLSPCHRCVDLLIHAFTHFVSLRHSRPRSTVTQNHE